MPPNAEPQKSFKNRTADDVRYGEPGSVRPDYWDEASKTAFEVKNYDLNKNLNGLKNSIKDQYPKRMVNLPPGSNQKYIIDIRGQQLTRSLDDIIKELTSIPGIPLKPDDITFIK